MRRFEFEFGLCWSGKCEQHWIWKAHEKWALRSEDSGFGILVDIGKFSNTRIFFLGDIRARKISDGDCLRGGKCKKRVQITWIRALLGI
jgi:hypothetical protein